VSSAYVRWLVIVYWALDLRSNFSGNPSIVTSAVTDFNAPDLCVVVSIWVKRPFANVAFDIPKEDVDQTDVITGIVTIDLGDPAFVSNVPTDLHRDRRVLEGLAIYTLSV
jgi:hypothetical protein